MGMTYYYIMSKRLVELMERLIVMEGSEGKAKLALAAKRGEQMIDRYEHGVGV